MLKTNKDWLEFKLENNYKKKKKNKKNKKLL